MTGVSGRAPYWADQCRLYPPKLSLGAHLPSVSCIPLLRTNGYLSYKSQMHIPEEALPASSVLPALPPPQSGLGALLRAPFCRYVMSCLGCSPSVQFSLVTQSYPTLCNPMDCSTPRFPVHHQFLEFTQTHVYWVSEAIQPSHPLSSLSLPALNLSQHQGLFKWVSSSHQVAKVLEFQIQHQSFQWIFRTDYL